ncbi:MAG: hypothetical protein A4S14_06700 [Proteobacteria bacterium SG_bin9]|nr:MAG: hypothetical protein A4S14_06700 [Proteobacteria bacterium SG_bin9]
MTASVAFAQAPSAPAPRRPPAPLKPQDICAKWATMTPMRLIVACSEVIRNDPNAAWAYLNRGIAHGASGDTTRELADYNKAIELDPKLANAYQNRAVIAFNNGEFASAAADFAKAVELNRDAYAVLFLHLAKAHGGETATTELEANAAKLKVSDWPYPVAELLLGKKTPTAVLTAATTREQKCEAQFYIGEFHAITSDKAAAEKPLRLAAGLCAKDAVEFTAAIAELKRLGFGPPKPRPARPAAAAAQAAGPRPASASPPPPAR